MELWAIFGTTGCLHLLATLSWSVDSWKATQNTSFVLMLSQFILYWQVGVKHSCHLNSHKGHPSSGYQLCTFSHFLSLYFYLSCYMRIPVKEVIVLQVKRGIAFLLLFSLLLILLKFFTAKSHQRQVEPQITQPAACFQTPNDNQGYQETRTPVTFFSYFSPIDTLFSPFLATFPLWIQPNGLYSPLSLVFVVASVRTTSAEGSSGEGLCQDAQNMSQAKTREW